MSAMNPDCKKKRNLQPGSDNNLCRYSMTFTCIFITIPRCGVSAYLSHPRNIAWHARTLADADGIPPGGWRNTPGPARSPGGRRLDSAQFVATP
jgi:hypothetical protein